MTRAEQFGRTLAFPLGASEPHTLRSAPLALRTEPDDEDTIAVPLADAATLPCPPPALDELPTLRAAPGELAKLIAQTRRSDALPPPKPQVPQQIGRSAEPPVRHPDCAQTRRPLQGSSLPVAPPVRHPNSGQTHRRLQESSLPVASPVRHPDCAQTRRQLQGSSLPVASPVRHPDCAQTRRQLQESSLPVASPVRHPDCAQTRRQLQGSSLPVASPVRHPDSGQTRRQLRGLSRPAAATIRPVELLSQPRLRGSLPSAGGAAMAAASPAGGVSAMMPTQLWLGPVAADPALSRPPQRRGFWARLWTLLGLRARPRAQPFSVGAAGISGNEGRLAAGRR